MTYSANSVNMGILSWVGNIMLANPKFVVPRSSNMISGQTVLYTCPSGRVAVPYGGSHPIANPVGVSTILSNLQLFSGGSYRRVTGNSSSATGTATNISNGYPMLVAGEILAITTNNAGLNITPSLIEFDANSPITRGLFLDLANGDNTLYTCPAGKVATILSNSRLPGTASPVNVCNSSGAARNYMLNLVPSGGSPSSSNRVLKATAVSDLALTPLNFGPAVLTAGDYININTNSGVAGQNAWVHVLELPA